MQTQSKPQSVSPKKREIGDFLRLTGRISFWVELAFAAICVLSLLFAITGRNFSEETNPAIGIGIFWAVCSVLVVGFNIYLAFRWTRIGRALLTLSPELRPSKTETIRLLRFGVMASLGGMFLALLGSGATLGLLVAKAVSQPPGVAITDPNQIIRGLDVFVMVANVNGIAAHFVANVSSLWLLEQVHRH
ncbi:MAG TPA: DUF3611 family protein [Coleofasciculaceae cyanobacterium]